MAVDLTNGGVGIGSASGMKKEDQAEKSALLACKDKGGTRCSVRITYSNQCASLIWGSQ
ncbi:DUF4189 domain-containing protein [Lysobacter sp. ISL-42]|nr:DUF4189 domain-containing protein [Lysobacter sp. ISL-42]MBT2750612.1 DUF4189 domain-containing protein [Lysobacter sp. ISL-50]MBT2776458.1 DUF4189 domain-containing protein [Lysobacter sp. ISL-54]MBT2780953.1 DUF4189 domain-containing protein [Lysobacter sp. ISL-52]